MDIENYMHICLGCLAMLVLIITTNDCAIIEVMLLALQELTPLEQLIAVHSVIDFKRTPKGSSHSLTHPLTVLMQMS